MERKENTLYFKHAEKERFLRAITLTGRMLGLSKNRVELMAEHEEAHIRKAKEFNAGDRMEYFITVNRKRHFWFFPSKTRTVSPGIYFDSANLTPSQLIRISMAPQDPSATDYYTAIRRLDFNKEWTILKAMWKENRGEIPRYREYLLRKAYEID